MAEAPSQLVHSTRADDVLAASLSHMARELGIQLAPNLCWACEHDHEELAMLLLRAGALVDQTTCYIGQQAPRAKTALHWACFFGRARLIAALLAKGARVDRVDDVGWTPLHAACADGHVEVVALLLAKGARIDRVDDVGRTPLHVTCAGGHAKVAALLLARIASWDARSVDCKDLAGRTPLHLACAGGHADVVRQLITRRTLVGYKDIAGRTPLHLACAGGHADVAKQLLAKGAAADCACERGITPLGLACCHATYRAAGGAVDRRPALLAVLFKWAIGHDREKLAVLLLEEGAAVEHTRELHRACEFGHVKLVAALLAKGADVGHGRGITGREVLPRGHRPREIDGAAGQPLYRRRRASAARPAERAVEAGGGRVHVRVLRLAPSRPARRRSQERARESVRARAARGGAHARGGNASDRRRAVPR